MIVCCVKMQGSPQSYDRDPRILKLVDTDIMCLQEDS